MKIDEAVKMCQDTETLILNTGRYNDEVFQTAKSQKFSAVKLKQLIQDLNGEMEKFPRKNRHSNEWHEKYAQKFADLQQQADSVESTQLGIRDLLG